MLEYQNHIPVTAGSALVPGGTGNPPRLVYTGFYATALASFPSETWDSLPIPGLPSGFYYPPDHISSVFHGFEQRFDWRNLVYNTAHQSAFMMYGSGFGQSGSSYRRYNHGQPIAAQDNIAYRMFNKAVNCSSEGVIACFDITSIQYMSEHAYMDETINMPGAYTGTAVPYSATMIVGDHTAMSSAGTIDLSTPGGGIFEYHNIEIPSNYFVGGYSPTSYWTGSSTVTQDSWDMQNRVSYEYLLESQRPLSAYNGWRRNTTSIASTSYLNHIRVEATAYGNIYIY